MFVATLSNVKVLKDSIDTIAQIIDEGNFRIRPSGIELMAADRAMVAVVDFKMDAEAFDSYSCDKETAAGLNMINFLTILKRAGSDDKLTLKLNEGRMEILLEGNSRRRFAMPLIDITAEDVPSVAQFEFPASAEISGDIIAKGIDDADIVADSVIMEVDENSLKMFAEGGSSKAELNLDKASPALLSITAPQAVRSRYPLDYLKKIMRASKLAANAKIQLGRDYPLRIDFNGEKSKLGFVLAPRVSEE